MPNPTTSSCQLCTLQMLPETHSFTVNMWISVHYIRCRELGNFGLSLKCINDIWALSGFYAASVRNCCSQTSYEKLPEAHMPNRTTIYKVHEDIWGNKLHNRQKHNMLKTCVEWRNLDEIGAIMVKLVRKSPVWLAQKTHICITAWNATKLLHMHSYNMTVVYKNQMT